MEKTVKEVVWRKGRREVVEKSAFKARRSSNPREKKKCKKDAEDPAVKLERLNLNEKKRKEKMERDASEIKTPKILKKKKIVEVGKKALQSDMEFDQASTNDWETDYQVIQKKFNEQGYGSAIPEIVFWNLRDSRSTPIAGKQNGAALVSGFSKNILNLFLEGDGPLNPEVIMESAISGPEYNNLHVFD
ncbi:plant/protein [Thalictrum thalictroides]|uniref:Plant/protein n=1 Tax=Thalictrum thalictroides TaxID=46969 RepID=A0A7J6XCE8_THATH|nr:plant/protein [Thalictrum thalictroides]